MQKVADSSCKPNRLGYLDRMKTTKEIEMIAEIIKSNEWAQAVTDREVDNWIQAMVECGRTEDTGYWEPKKMVRCPYNQPLALV